MKTRLFAVILADLVLLISPLSAGETYEILTDSAGRKLEAAILKYARDGVTVKRLGTHPEPPSSCKFC